MCKIELKIRDYFINRRTCKGVSRAAPPLQRSNLRGQRQSRRTLQNEIVPESSLSARRTMLLSVPTERHAARKQARANRNSAESLTCAPHETARAARPGRACARWSMPKRLPPPSAAAEDPQRMLPEYHPHSCSARRMFGNHPNTEPRFLLQPRCCTCGWFPNMRREAVRLYDKMYYEKTHHKVVD